MRKGVWFIASLLLVAFSALGQGSQLRVGVFNGHGGSETCVWEAMASIGMDRSLKPELVTTGDIARGKLDQIDVLVVPGGGGSRQYLNMGSAGREAVKRFVSEGKGLVGICAGAYLISDTPEYASLSMSGMEAIDIEHDNRGRGIAKVTLTDLGRDLFPEVADEDTLFIMYYEGPVAIPSENSSTSVRSYATMDSDVHVEGNAPSNMTNNKSFLYISEFGKGKTASVVGHPEATPGMQWMISRLVHEVAPRKVEAQLDRKFIDPSKFGQEILMTKERRSMESEAFTTFLYQGTQEKLEALKWLMTHNSWDAKRWIQGLIFSSEPELRKATAEWISWAMYRTYLHDLKAALASEQDADLIKVYEQAIKALE